MTGALISAEHLRKILDEPGVKLLDASYGLPTMGERIGNAVDFDIDEIADPDATQPHTLPSPEVFAELVGELGIGNNDRVIVYDRAGMAMAAARAWWMFRVFGHDKVQILDGGLPFWLKKNYPLQPVSGEPPARRVFRAKFRPELFRRRKDILDNLNKKSFTVVDARDAKRYSGEAPEPRPGIEPGHIPGSLNVPYASLIEPSTGLLRKKDELKNALRHVSTSKPIVVSCGSGVTACVVALALYQTGNQNAAIYGGSWMEWGGDPSLPKTKGGNP
ncbi:MAG: sulfurtransferase [Alphaproteobacteria bacterium]|nr:MAG: sulfurtransferase [Alphaproteobacteria bacterium]